MRLARAAFEAPRRVGSMLKITGDVRLKFIRIRMEQIFVTIKRMDGRMDERQDTAELDKRFSERCFQ